MTASIFQLDTRVTDLENDSTPEDFDALDASLNTYGTTLPWNVPWGYVNQNTSTATTTGITSDTDVVTVTWTAVANRRYRLTAQVNFQKKTNAGEVFVKLTDNSNALVQPAVRTMAIDAYGAETVQYIVSPGAGSTTYKVRISANNSSVSLALPGGGVHYIRVDDMGPSAAP